MFLYVFLNHEYIGGSDKMKSQKKYTRTLRIRIDPDLLEDVRNESENREIDVSSYVRWCLRTGLYLKELNTFIYSKSGEYKRN
jgi:hypothetical protein